MKRIFQKLTGTLPKTTINLESKNAAAPLQNAIPKVEITQVNEKPLPNYLKQSSNTSQRLLLKDYFDNKYSFKRNRSCVEGAVQRYVQLRTNKEMKLNELSEIYDYIRQERHEIESVCNALKLLHNAPSHIDILFIAKKLFYSVTQNSSLEDQILFFHTLEKLNLMRYQTNQYLEFMDKIGKEDFESLKNIEDEDALSQSFFTLSKTLDMHQPNGKKDLKVLNHTWKNNLLKIIKEDSYTFNLQQHLDLLEALNFQQSGSIETTKYLLDKIDDCDGLEFKSVDEALHLCNLLDQLPEEVVKTHHDQILDQMSSCFDYLQENFDLMQHADQFMIMISFFFNWDQMNKHHYTNKNDEEVKKFLDERTLLLHHKMNKLSQQSPNIINQISSQTVTNFITNVLNSEDEFLKNKIFEIFPRYFEQESCFHELVHNKQLEQVLSSATIHYNKTLTYKSFKLMHSLQYLMSHKIEKHSLNFNCFINILESDVESNHSEQQGLKTLYESDGGLFIDKMLKTRECDFKELDVIQRALKKSPDSFQDHAETYKLTVNQSLKRIVKDL